MGKPLLYDVFCGAGGCSRGYQMAGFRVIGIDKNPQPRYCGDAFIQMDAMEFLSDYNAGKYEPADAISCSPPCQCYSTMRHLPNAKPHPDLVAPTRKLLQASGKPWVIENVVGAPLINPTMLCGTMFGLGTGGADLRRHRLFETNWTLVLPFGMHCRHGRRGAGKTICVIGQRGIAEDRAARWEDQRARKTITVTGSHGDAGISHTRQVKERLRKAATVNIWGNAGGHSNRDGLIYFSTAERNEAMGIDWMKGGEISQAIPPAYTEFIGRQLADHLYSK